MTLASNLIFPFFDYSITGIAQEDYKIVPTIIETVQAIEKTEPKRGYLILDYHKHCVIYASDRPFFFADHKPMELVSNYHKIIKETMSETTLNHFKLQQAAFSKFYPNLSEEDRKALVWEWNLSLSSNITHRKHLLNWKMSHLMLSRTGDLWLGLVTVSFSNKKEGALPIITNTRTKEQLTFSADFSTLQKCPQITLTNLEKQIILLSLNGYDTKALCEHLCKSNISIKKYRSSLYRKFGVKSMPEVIDLALAKGLI